MGYLHNETPEPAVAETLWLEKIVDIRGRENPMLGPDGVLLLITLANGKRISIPLFGEARKRVYDIANPITITGKMPINGSGAS